MQNGIFKMRKDKKGKIITIAPGPEMEAKEGVWKISEDGTNIFDPEKFKVVDFLYSPKIRLLHVAIMNRDNLTQEQIRQFEVDVQISIEPAATEW